MDPEVNYLSVGNTDDCVSCRLCTRPECIGGKRTKRKSAINPDNCTGCRVCIKNGCPAIKWQPESEDSVKGKAYVDPEICDGCGLCRNICMFDAIYAVKE